MKEPSRPTKRSQSKYAGRPFPQEVLDITGEELLDFFEQLDPDAGCSVCNGDLKIMAAVEYDAEKEAKTYIDRPAIVGLPVHEDPKNGSTWKTPCFVVNCEACGHIHYFMVNPVVKWKKEHGNDE